MSAGILCGLIGVVGGLLTYLALERWDGRN